MPEQSELYDFEVLTEESVAEVELTDDEIVENILELYWEAPHETGFKEREQLSERFERGEVVFSINEGEIVSAADYRHLKDRLYTTVYTSALRDGYGEQNWIRMIRRILRDSPYNRLISKVPVQSEENLLWRKMGRKVNEVEGKNSPLYVWLVEGDYETASFTPLSDW